MTINHPTTPGLTLVVSVAQALRSASMGGEWVARHPWDDPDSDHEPYLTWAQAAIDRAGGEQ